MTERREETQIEQAIARLISEGRISRRSFLRRASRGGLVLGSALSLPAILAAVSWVLVDATPHMKYCGIILEEESLVFSL